MRRQVRNHYHCSSHRLFGFRIPLGGANILFDFNSAIYTHVVLFLPLAELSSVLLPPPSLVEISVPEMRES